MSGNCSEIQSEGNIFWSFVQNRISSETFSPPINYKSKSLTPFT